MNYIAIPGFKRGEHNLSATVAYSPNNIETIVYLVEQHFGFTFLLLKSATRKREICYARQVLMYLLSQKTNLTLNSIGQMIGGRDHTTVIYTKSLIKDLMEIDEGVRNEINNLLKSI
jgi:chromosomal replication initiator protein